VPTHGHNAQFTYNSNDVSPYVTDVTFKRSNDVHDTTCYGSSAHTYLAGLVDGEITVTGLWDKTSTVGSEVVFNGAVGVAAASAFAWGPEGSTAGDVKYTGNAVLKDYQESAPVADLVKFTATLSISGAVTTGTYA